MTAQEPLHVQFARVCMGWTDLAPMPPAMDGWTGLDSKGRRAYVPRVDLTSFDLMPWEEANRLKVDSPMYHLITSEWVCAQQEHGWLTTNASSRETVLRCLIALFEAGKGVRP